MLAACAGAGRASADEVRSRVFAGSGILGIADGAANEATFLMPTQLALSPSGDLFVTDTAAQRVREVDRAGNVTTVAGGGAVGPSGVWVDGGFANGAAAAARFDRPDGIAVEPNGTLLVADRGNHCIRAIASGVVSTYAGDPKNGGNADGPLATATFASPRQLALDADGTLYVADWGNGIRAIAGGRVRTLAFAGTAIDRPTGVAIVRSGSRRILFVADAKGLVRVELATLAAERFPAFPAGTDEPGTISSDVPLGVPHAIAAFDAGDVAFTDLRDSSVKYVRLSSVLRHLGAVPREDAMLTGGGAGPGQFESPMGVAVDAKDVTYVADTGNRRIVRIEPFDRKRFVTSADLSSLNYPKGRYRIALLGSSFTWWGSSFDDSIAGLLDARLAGVPALAARPPDIRYFQISLTGEFDLIDTVLANGVADTVVLLLSPVDPYGLNRGVDPAGWGAVVRDRVVRSAAALKKAGIPLLLAIDPGQHTVSPLDSSYVYQGERADDPTDYEREHAALLQVLAGVDVPLLDLYPVFRAELARRDHHPLFNTANTHYSPYGRALVANAIYEAMVSRAPWNAKP